MESSTPAGTVRQAAHHGQGTEMFTIFIVNLLLKLVTLGLYHFWAKTRVRRYLWSQTEFDGERFEYRGTGLELFYGFILALIVLISLFLAMTLLSAVLVSVDPGLGVLVQVAVYTALLTMVGMGIYGARRYLMSRTALRGIRLAQSGSPLRFAIKLLGHATLSLLTAYLYLPVMRERLRDYQINHTWYGDQQFEYDGQARDLFGKYLICWLLMIPTLTLSWLWYRAAELRYIAEHTRLRGLRFTSRVRGGELLRLHFGNLLIILLSLGLAYPWALIRTTRFTFSHLEVEGELAYHQIAQSGEHQPATGDGLVEVFNMGGI